MSTLTISGKAIGARRPLFADWSVPLPPDWGDAGGRTLRDLIGCVVRSEVRAFRDRQSERQVFRAGGKLFLPLADDDPRTAEVMSKVLLFARDQEIQDPTILEQIRA
jgi:hypothetical protein